MCGTSRNSDEGFVTTIQMTMSLILLLSYGSSWWFLRPAVRCSWLIDRATTFQRQPRWRYYFCWQRKVDHLSGMHKDHKAPWIFWIIFRKCLLSHQSVTGVISWEWLDFLTYNLLAKWFHKQVLQRSQILCKRQQITLISTAEFLCDVLVVDEK